MAIACWSLSINGDLDGLMSKRSRPEGWAYSDRNDVINMVGIRGAVDDELAVGFGENGDLWRAGGCSRSGKALKAGGCCDLSLQLGILVSA